MLGRYFDNYTLLTRGELDVTNSDETDKIFKKNKPEAVIHLAAATDMAWCESDPDMARLVNATGTRNVATAAERENILMVYVSTDAVFDGKKETP